MFHLPRHGDEAYVRSHLDANPTDATLLSIRPRLQEYTDQGNSTAAVSLIANLTFGAAPEKWLAHVRPSTVANLLAQSIQDQDRPAITVLAAAIAACPELARAPQLVAQKITKPLPEVSVPELSAQLALVEPHTALKQAFAESLARSGTVVAFAADIPALSPIYVSVSKQHTLELVYGWNGQEPAYQGPVKDGLMALRREALRNGASFQEYQETVVLPHVYGMLEEAARHQQDVNSAFYPVKDNRVLQNIRHMFESAGLKPAPIAITARRRLFEEAYR